MKTCPTQGPSSVAVQLRRSAASDRAAWVATGAMMLLWAFAWVFWEKQILDSGAPPAINSWINFVFLAGYPGLLATLAILLWRRERDVVCFVDVGIVAAALFMIVWTVLLRRYADIDLVPLGGRVVQIGYATFDIAVLAVVVRLLIAPWRRSPAFAFLPVAGLAILFSDVIWNWSTQLGTYSPGSWADGGWLLAPAAVGAAALHRSATDLFQPAEVTARGLRRDRLAVLMSAALVGPVLLGVRLFDNSLGPSELWVIAVGMAVVVVLVLARLALTLREKESLASQLATQNRQLLELDRLKDDFVASVSHELRTPLTSIRGYLDLVREGEGGELNEDQQRFLGIVDRNADRLLRVVSDLLFVAQVGAGKLDLALEEVDVAEVVDHAADAARPHAGGRARLGACLRRERRRRARGLGHGAGDVVGGAGAAVPAFLSHCCGDRERDPGHRPGAHDFEGDRGRARRHRRRHERGGGGDNLPGRAARRGRSTRVSGEPPLVLVADNDPDIRSLVAFRLERANYEVVQASGGEEALRLARERQPALAVLDVMMPKLTGYRGEHV